MKTSELTGAALDWAVAKIEYTNPVTIGSSTLMVFKDVPFDYHPSTNWAQGGVIIEREGISTWVFDDVTWKAENPFTSGVDQVFEGSTPLIAAMRCFVASRLEQAGLTAFELPPDVADAYKAELARHEKYMKQRERWLKISTELLEGER